MAALAPDVLIQLGPVPITNTLVNTLLIDAVILAGVFALKGNITKIPGLFQNAIEVIVETFYNLTESIAGKNAQKIFPYFFTFFIFILLSNLSGLVPGAESIGFYPKEDTYVAKEKAADDHAEEVPAAVTTEEVHTADKPINKDPDKGDTVTAHAEEEEAHHLVSLNRNLTSDLNATLALALISLVATHMLSIKTLGLKEYLGRFFSLNPILLFVGLLEIVSEITKVISLSFRLFGNIYAGEVVLATIASLGAFLFPIPFMLLEIIVGLVQALVFSMLTMVFMSVLMTPHHAESHAASEEVKH